MNRPERETSMKETRRMQRLLRGWRGLLLAAMAAAASGLSACSAPQTERSTGVLGYGTPDVSSFTGVDQAGGLQAELDRCRQASESDVASQTQGLVAACRQLERTRRNQPGNTVR